MIAMLSLETLILLSDLFKSFRGIIIVAAAPVSITASTFLNSLLRSVEIEIGMRKNEGPLNGSLEHGPDLTSATIVSGCRLGVLEMCSISIWFNLS